MLRELLFDLEGDLIFVRQCVVVDARQLQVGHAILSVRDQLK